MNRKRALSSGPKPLFLVVMVVFLLSELTPMAQPVQHLTIPQPGGMPGLPVMMGIVRATNGVSVMWDGPSGYYQVWQKKNLLDASWTAVGKATNLIRIATITPLSSNAFFRVSGPAPLYIGSQACTECHGNIQTTVLKTPHASAFTNLAFAIASRTVGYGLPGGFVSQAKTPQLANVQCENCHGPAANHAANEMDITVRPQVELSGAMCGGCHAGPAHPTYDEWSTSGHSAVVPDALQTMSSSTNNLSSCGRCHSGSVRLALINGQNPATLTNDLNVAITCAVCHDPHQLTANPVQLLNPLASTNDYFLTTSTNFASAYKPNINICGQCHNDRGTVWTDTSRAPHHSVQYNFLLGSVGEFAGGSATFSPDAHTGLPDSAQFSTNGIFYLTNQCVSCHMQQDAPPASTHTHTFEVASHDVCMNCHQFDPGESVPAVSNQVSSVIFFLNRWAALKAPPALQTNGAVLWEYTAPGGLTWQTNSLGFVTGWTELDQVNYSGPNAAGQALIPDNIKKARFNLYLVVNDGSVGVHNPNFSNQLLTAAQGFVQQELLK